MKRLLGAIAAALVLCAGCAHDQEKTARTEVPSTSQAQVGDSVALSGLDCEVISTGGSGAAGSGTIQNEPSASVTTGSAMGQSKCEPGEASAGAAQSSALGGSASQDNAIGGSATEDLETSDLAKDDEAFEKTDMGGTGGGG